MNYKKIYDSLINKGKNRILEGYYERHHIVPRCIGGNDSEENIVNLTPEEHYLAHQLLVKIYPKNHSLVKAAAMMIPNRPSNKMYGWLRRKFSEAQSESQSGSGNSQYGTMWITNGIEEIKIRNNIPDGWQKGRLSSFKKQKEKEILKEQKLTAKKEELRRWHEIYVEYGFDGVKKAGYKYSKPNLVMSFAKYLPEFIPQNGKKRSIHSRVADK